MAQFLVTASPNTTLAQDKVQEQDMVQEQDKVQDQDKTMPPLQSPSTIVRAYGQKPRSKVRSTLVMFDCFPL